MKFKTNAKCDGCKTKILAKMNETFPDAQWSLDLDSTDKVLEVHGLPEDEPTARKIETTLAETGFKGSWLRETGY